MPTLIDNLDGVRVTGGRVAVRASDEFHRRYLKEDFFAEYDPPPADFPDTAALVPFLASAVPVAFASGEEWTVPHLDRTFAIALEDLRVALARGHPHLTFDGRVTAARIVDSPSAVDASYHVRAALFSGGVDSVYTAIAHRSEPLLLVTVDGADIPLYDDESWRRVRSDAEEFASVWGFGNAFVRSNFRTFLDIPRIEAAMGAKNWWREVQHGIGLIGLTAPLVPLAEGEAHVVIAATHGDTYTATSGSNEAVDETMRWGSVKTDHHGWNTRRTAKMRLIAAWAADERRPLPTLRVCFGAYGLEHENCLRCEKCLRTAAGLILTGGDATQLHPHATSASMVTRIESSFRWHRIRVAESTTYHWHELQSRAEAVLIGGAPTDPSIERLASWFARRDFDRYARRRRPITAFEEAVITALRRFPSLERMAKRTRGMFKRALR